MVFRELYNQESNCKLKLKFLKDKKIRITDLGNGNVSDHLVTADGIGLHIEKPAGYLFMKYEIAE
jgi:hypothetical protein